MKLVDIESVEPGQTLGKTIFSSNGAVLLSTGVQLTVFMISTLKRIGVTSIYIDDPMYRDISNDELLSDETKQAVIHRMSETFEQLRSGKTFSAKAIGQSVDEVLDDVMRNQNPLDPAVRHPDRGQRDVPARVERLHDLFAVWV